MTSFPKVRYIPPKRRGNYYIIAHFRAFCKFTVVGLALRELNGAVELLLEEFYEEVVTGSVWVEQIA